MAVVTGTSAKDFIHVAGDGLVAPGGYVDNPNATDSSDDIDISQGGRDIVFAGRGNDLIYAGASLTDGDQIVGGGGDDTLSLDGDYSRKLTFKPTTISAIDALTLAGGHDYNLRMDDGNVTGVSILTIDASGLGVGDSFIFDGRREQDSLFYVTGGAGDDVLRGGTEENLFDLRMGGNDHVVGNSPLDEFDFGTTFNQQDFVDGGNSATLNLAAGTGTTTDLTLNYDYVRNLHTINLEGSFNITAKNNFLRPGQQIFVNGEGYDGSSVLMFDGSRERDSATSYALTGGLGDDILTGGRGNDAFWGLDGKDILTPGAGTNFFLYGRNRAAESTSLGYDIINGFDCNTDVFGFHQQFITQVRSTVATGQLSTATFDSDLAAAVQASNLIQGCAVLFTPTGGDLSGRTFLVVNGDNQAGYSGGSDYVMEIRNMEHVAQFGTGNFGIN